MKFKSAKELQEKINAYFESCWEEQWEEVSIKDSEGNKITKWEPLLNHKGEIVKVQTKPYTITGLALVLGTTRETLLDYQNKEEFSDTIRNAKLKCMNYAEESLWTPKIATGIIFNLVNNYGWQNKQEVDANLNLVNKLEDIIK